MKRLIIVVVILALALPASAQNNSKFPPRIPLRFDVPLLSNVQTVGAPLNAARNPPHAIEPAGAAHLTPSSAVPATPAAGNLNAQKSSGFLNGRFWNAQPDPARLNFLLGYAEHLTFAETLGQEEPEWSRFPHAPVTYAEIVNALNRMYASPENLDIPVVLAIGAFQMRVAGSTEEEINESLELARKTFATPPPGDGSNDPKDEH